MVRELEGSVDFSVTWNMVDVDSDPAAAREWDVTAVPDFLFFRGGQLIDRFLGVPVGPARNAFLDRLRTAHFSGSNVLVLRLDRRENKGSESP